MTDNSAVTPGDGRIERVAEGPRTEAARKAIEKLRMNLLDITNRNKLVSMKHSEKARTHVRVIDELPDELMAKLEDGKTLAFKALPEPPDDPEDEKNDAFQMALEEARAGDPEYLAAIEKLEGDDPSSRKAQKIERDLRDRVREQLGWGKRAHTDVMSIAEYARAHGYEPSYDLPEPDGAQPPHHHTDNEVQTLLLPEQMERKLSGLTQQARSALQEMGTNTLYVAVGFLEWYESQSSAKPLVAPLLLHPVEISRRLVSAQYRYEIASTGEETEVNITLSERLARDFGLRLPDYADADSPESYFDKVREQIVRHHPRWKIRRFVTIGHFSFARLVMYRDLDPANWPDGREMYTHAGLSALLGGSNAEEGTSAEPYAVDDPEIACKVPLLISDADSSQFSAIVDVMDGKNLAIEGPPGTGKSQTITNVIGAAMAQGKRVLFIAEKMAALQVVKSRLDAAGLGDFAFELHSTKARKGDVLESLQARLGMPRERHPERLEDARRTLSDLKEQLTRYVDLLNTRFGRLGMTIQEILWAEQRTREADLPAALADVALDGADETTPYAMDEAKGQVRVIETHVADFVAAHGSLAGHPWYGVELQEIGPFDREAILRALTGWREVAERLAGDLEHAPGLAATPADARRLVAARDALPGDCGPPALFQQLGGPEALQALAALTGDLDAWADARRALAARCDDPEALTGNADQLAGLAREADRLRLGGRSLEELSGLVERERAGAARWRELVELAGQLLAGLGLEGPASARRCRPAVAAGRLAADLDRRLLLLRTPELVDETSAEILERGRRTRDDLVARQQELERTLKLPLRQERAPAEMRMMVGALRRTGLFAGLAGEVRRARRYYKQLAAGSKGAPRATMADRLSQAADLIEAIHAFACDGELKAICGARFEGIDTDFEALLDVNRFASRVRQELAGVDGESRAARRLLLHAGMEDLDDLLALARDPRFEQLAAALDDLGRGEDVQLEELARLMGRRADDVETLAGQAGALGLAPATPVEQLGELHARAQDLDSARAAVQGNADALAALETAGATDRADPAADRGPLETAAAAAETVHALDLPEATRAHLFAADYAERRDALVALADALADDLDGYDAARDAAVEAAQLSLADFLQAEPEVAAMPDLLARLHRAEAEPGALQGWASYVAARRRAAELGLGQVLAAFDAEGRRYHDLELAYERALYRSLARAAYEAHPDLRRFSGVTQEDARARFKQTDRELIQLERRALRAQLASAAIPRGNSEGLVRDKTELGLIRHVLSLKKPRTPIRDLVDRAGRAIQEMKPCFMMSPLSVAQYLKPGNCEFDLVVIDEASQMKPEDAIGGLVRAGQIVVVGDPKQLPPTSFFDRVGGEPVEEDEEATDADQIESILETAMNCWQPYRRLLWHYRSRHGSLIAFSNEKFYDGELIVFPAPVKDNPEYGVRMEHVSGTCRRGGTNLKEAQCIAEAAVEFMRLEARKDEDAMRSLGVVAMNRAQTELIADEISRLLQRVPDAYAYTEVFENRGGGIESFFVKNLENVQGDERDVIYISTTYGPDPDSGKVHQRFGPINTDLGYRRLNVLFTRAKEQVKLFTSLHAADVNVRDETVKRGRRALHDYLEYAATGRLHGGDGNGCDPDNDFERFVKARLEARGFDVACQVGVAGYYIDLAVSHPAFPDGYLAGVECDGATYHSAMSARDRDRLRQEVLENLGWDIYRVWSTDWFADPDAETDKLDRHLRGLLNRKAPAASERERSFGAGAGDPQPAEPDASGPWEAASDATAFGVAPNSLVRLDADPVVEVGDAVVIVYADDPARRITLTISPDADDPDRGILHQDKPLSRALLGNGAQDEIEGEAVGRNRSATIVWVNKGAQSYNGFT